MVGVDACPRDDRRRACMNRFAEKILELARLVPAERQTREIVPFHIDRDRAQRVAKPQRGFERGRQMRERYVWPTSERPAQVSGNHTVRHWTCDFFCPTRWPRPKPARLDRFPRADRQ